MSQYGANKVATAVLLDTSPGMDVITSDGTTHFERSKWILSRIILRKIFAYETDEVGLLTFGLSGVKTVSNLKVPNWDMFRVAEDVTIDDGKGTQNGGNWARALIKAVDFLEEECQGKRFKSRQLVVLSNFTWSSPDITNRLDTLITIINAKVLKVIVIGVDIKKESQDACDTPLGLGELVEFVSKLDCGYTQSFEEVEEDLKFYEKKKKAKRLTKASMRIGSQINMPFKWMKVTNEDTRLKFAPPRKDNQSLFARPGLISEPAANGNTESVAGIRKADDPLAQKSFMPPGGEVECPSPLKKLKGDFVSPEEDRKFTVDDSSHFELKFAQDESRKTRFGATEVLLTYADLEAMKRKTGPPSLTFLGTVRSSKITRSMIVGEDVYVIVSDGTKRSHAQLTALINALLKQNKYGLARRIASKDGKVNVGILYPVSDELGKALYFLKVPLADWVKSVPSRALPDVVEQPLVDMMNDLIDAMSIDGKGRDLLLRDPNFQTRAALVENRARSLSEQPFPDHISALFDPYPELREAGDGIIEKILEAYNIPLPPPTEEEPTASKNGAAKVSDLDVAPKKELSDAEKKEVAEIEALVSRDPDSILLEAEHLYEQRQENLKMDTEDIFKLVQSPF